MRQIIELGSAPYAEDCVQVRSDRPYMIEMRRECELYRDQLRRLLDEHDPLLSGFIAMPIKRYEHDFGPYLEVCISYDDADPRVCDLAFWLENNLPEFWDEKAKERKEESC